MQIKRLPLNTKLSFPFCTGPLKTLNPTKYVGKLTILPTPIGNLQDLSPNIIKSLFKADVIGCQDRRVAGKLYTLIKSKNIMQNLVQNFGEVGLSSLIPLNDTQNQPKTQQQENYLFYEYANMSDKHRRKFLRKMTKQQQQKFKIDFLKYRAMKILQKEDDFLKKQKQDKFDELYGIDTSDLEHIELQIRNTRMKKGRGVLIPLNTYSQTRMFNMVRMFLETKNVAIISDAGMPCISDPGWKMVRKIRQTHPQIPVQVIGGPSSVSLITLLASMSAPTGKDSISGRFEGFAPEIVSQMTERSVRIEEAKKRQFSIHFLNSKKLRNKVIEMEKNYGPDQKILLANELTKMYQRRYHGSLGELNNLMSKEDNDFEGIGELSYLVYPPPGRQIQQKRQEKSEKQKITKEEKVSLARLSLISMENFIDSIKQAEEEINGSKVSVGSERQNMQKPKQKQSEVSSKKQKQKKFKNEEDSSSKDLIELVCTVFGTKTSQARKMVYQKQIVLKNKKSQKSSSFLNTSQAYEKQQKQEAKSDSSKQQPVKRGRRGGRNSRQTRQDSTFTAQQQQIMDILNGKNGTKTQFL